MEEELDSAASPQSKPSPGSGFKLEARILRIPTHEPTRTRWDAKDEHWIA